MGEPLWLSQVSEATGFKDVALSGNPPIVSDSTRLEYLGLDLDDLDGAWMDVNRKHLSSVRELWTCGQPDGILVDILDNCPALVELTCDEPVDEHLEAILWKGSVSFQPLDLVDGRFSTYGLSMFIEDFPPSITRLSLWGSSGLTPTHFRMLLQLPSLQLLDVGCMYVNPKHLLELEEIAKNELPLGLRVKWKFTAEY